MTIILYQIPISGPCRAVIMAAQHLGVKLDKKLLDLRIGEHMKPEFLAINPQHCVPTIDDDGFMLWDSHVIMTYLVNKYSPESTLYPKDPQQRATVDRFLYYDVGTLNKARADYIVPQLLHGKPADPEKEETLKKALELLEKFLEETTYVAADHLTLADFSIVATISFIEEMGNYNLAPYPKISAWLERLKMEIPNYEEINEVPMKAFKEYLKSKK